VPDYNRSGAAEIAREVNAHILAMEARITRNRDGFGLFCECGCMRIVVTTRQDYEREGGAWLEGDKPT
jgi:hypothetical protein